MQTKKKRLPIWFWKELQGCMMNEEWWTVLFGKGQIRTATWRCEGYVAYWD